MIIQTIVVGSLKVNCYLVADEEAGEGVVIDPGAEAEKILRAVRREGVQVRYVLNTHAHFDHMGANAELVEKTGAPLALHPADRALLRAQGGAHWFGLMEQKSPSPEIELTSGQRIEVGGLTLEVLHTPGHSPGGVSFYLAEEGVVFVGDVLFASGIGRTDLPGGDRETLRRSIREVLLRLPDETVVYPGHGPKTSIGQEKTQNPWL